MSTLAEIYSKATIPEGNTVTIPEYKTPSGKVMDISPMPGEPGYRKPFVPGGGWGMKPKPPYQKPLPWKTTDPSKGRGFIPPKEMDITPMPGEPGYRPPFKRGYTPLPSPPKPTIEKPTGAPSMLWTTFHDKVLMPFVSANAERLQEGLTDYDIQYLTTALNKIAVPASISGIGQEYKLPPPRPKKPVQEEKWYTTLLKQVTLAVPNVAKIITDYRLGKEAIRAGVQVTPKEPTPMIIPGMPTETSWITYLMIGAAGLGGFWMLRRYKYI